MRRRIVLAVLAAAVIPACSSKKSYGGPGGGPTQVSTEIAGGSGAASIATVTAASESQKQLGAPVARVWEVLPAVYEALGIPVTTIVSNEHTVGNSGFKLRRRLGSVPLQRYLECGGTSGSPNAETYEVNLSVMSQLHDVGNGQTAMVTRVDASARNPFGGQNVACSSSGLIERRMHEMIAERLK